MFKIFDNVGEFLENFRGEFAIFWKTLWTFKAEGKDLFQMMACFVGLFMTIIVLLLGVPALAITIMAFVMIPYHRSWLREIMSSGWEELIFDAAWVSVGLLALGLVPELAMIAPFVTLGVMAICAVFMYGIFYQLFVSKFVEKTVVVGQAPVQTQQPRPQPSVQQQAQQTKTRTSDDQQRGDRRPNPQQQRQGRSREVSVETDQGSVTVRPRQREDQS